jgi:hypothetical protein
VPEPRSRSPHAEPRELTELKRIKARQPELAEAVDLNVALIELQRRVQARAATPWVEFTAGWLSQQHAAGLPLLRFEDIALDWTEFRLVFRQTADVLRRFEALDPDDYREIQAVSRDGNTLQPLVVHWFNEAAARGRAVAPHIPKTPVLQEALDQVLALSMRPFLERCADLIQQRADFAAWDRAYCPLCGGEPEFAVLPAAGGRMLICGRCTARWPFDDTQCPFCRNGDRSRLPSFSSPDGLYRLYACDACRRYLKAYDVRQGGRPVMLAVDSVATLPLDAAAIQRGYEG